LRLRQIALMCRDLEAVVEELEAVLGLEVAFHDPGVGVFGLRNAVLPVGNGFLEVLTPTQQASSGERFLARRGGDGGYMVILQVDDLEAERRRLAELGVRVVWETTLESTGDPKTPGAGTLHLHPRDVGGAIASLDAMDPPDAWRWAGPDWRSHVRTRVVRGLTGARLAAPDGRGLARRWSEVLGRPLAGDDALPLDEGRLDFTAPEEPAREGLVRVELAAEDPAAAVRAARERGLPVRDEGSTPEIAIGGCWFALGAARGAPTP